MSLDINPNSNANSSDICEPLIRESGVSPVAFTIGIESFSKKSISLLKLSANSPLFCLYLICNCLKSFSF